MCDAYKLVDLETTGMDNMDTDSLDSVSITATDASAVNYYDVLDVHPAASRLEIREAYLKLKSTYASGSAALYSLMDEEQARDTLIRIEDAFRILNDDIKRSEFDKQMGFDKLVQGFRANAGVDDASNRLDSAVERLQFMRSQRDGAASNMWNAELRYSDSMFHKANNTPFIKTKATQASGEQVQARYKELLDQSDLGDGDLYRQLREAAGVSEDEMQDRTKVSIGYLKAIESNRFERLPQAVYVKGFLRSYFKYLMVPDAEKLVLAYAFRLQEWQQGKKD